MTDIPAQIPAPQQEVPLSDGAAALPPVVEQQDAGVPQPLLVNPVPVVPEQVSNVDQATPADWHPHDPLKRGVAAGHIGVYADKQPGGLADAKQHWGTFAKLADGGAIPARGDTADTMRIWKKFKADPTTLKPDESAALLNAVGQVGAATAQTPDLQFDPIARVASVGAGGEVRVSYPAKTHVRDLALQPLAPSGVERLRTLAHLGEGATKTVPIQDLTAPFLGIDTNHPTSDPAKLVEVVTGLANEMGSTPERVGAAITAGWRKMVTPAKPWERPFAMRNGVNPAEDALNDGLSANLVSAMRGGVSALDFTTHGEPAVSVLPQGGLAVSAPPTERNARLLRHLYPAFAKGGVTAWLPGEAAPTETAAKIPGAVYNDFFLRASGGHPMFKPGTHIVYDASDPTHPGTDLGPVLTHGPALKQDRLRSSDIDPKNLSDLLETHQWALVPGGNSTKAGLIRSGFNPISHVVGDTTQNLVFGITPDQARAHTTGEVVANHGTYSQDGFRPGDGLSFAKADDGQKSMTRLPAGDVHWVLSGVDRTAEPTDPPQQEMATTRARRRSVEVSGDLPSTIADLESRGAENLHVYAHQNQLDGFKTAWEHIYTDGTNTTGVLAKKASQAAHAGPVFVRNTEGLPDTVEPPQTARRGTSGYVMNGVQVISTDDIKRLTDLKANFLRLDGKAIVPDNASGDVALTNGKIVVHDPTPAAARLIQAARATGLPDSAFQYSAPGELAKNTPASMVTISGDRVHPLKQTRPDSSWASKFGIVFDPAWRTNTGVQELPTELTNHLANVYQAFLGNHQAAADLWGLQRIAVSGGYSKTPAYTEWGKLGGSIGLSAQHWQNPDSLMDHVIQLQSNGTIVPNVTPTPAYFVAHELGHVVHGALQFGTDGSGARKELLSLRRSLGADGIARDLSGQAVASPEEMVAEAVAEGTLASNPRPLARQVLSIIQTAYDRVGKARTRQDW